MSSACLILMLRRTELIEGSMRTYSEGVREMWSGVRRTSGVFLRRPSSWVSALLPVERWDKGRLTLLRSLAGCAAPRPAKARFSRRRHACVASPRT